MDPRLVSTHLAARPLLASKETGLLEGQVEVKHQDVGHTFDRVNSFQWHWEEGAHGFDSFGAAEASYGIDVI